MKKFNLKSYQLLDNKKWVPYGNIIDGIGQNLKVKEIGMNEMMFDTKDQADQYLRQHFENLGYTENK